MKKIVIKMQIIEDKTIRQVIHFSILKVLPYKNREDFKQLMKDFTDLTWNEVENIEDEENKK